MSIAKIIFPGFIFCFLLLGVHKLSNAVMYFPPEFSLLDIDCKNGLHIDGRFPFDVSGAVVSGGGDINGDGINDMSIGAHRADVILNGIPTLNVGETYIIYGKRGGIECPLRVSQLDSKNGTAITGTNRFQFLGKSVASGGDINSDGSGDLLVEDVNATTYVIYGGGDFSGGQDLIDNLDGANGFRIKSGANAAFIGDVNGDGITDIAITDRGAAPNGNNSGAVYVIYGSENGFERVFDISDIDGSNGFVMHGESTFGNGLDMDVEGAGDINGDGLGDIVVGITQANNGKGRGYVVYGVKGGLNHPFELSGLDGNNGTILEKSNAFGIGQRVSSAGDINNDGIGDVMIAIRHTGSVYVVYGNRAGLPFPLDLGALDGSNGFRIIQFFHNSDIKSVGDINNDDIDDIAISLTNLNNTGGVYVLFGSADLNAGTLDLEALDGINGFVITGEAIGDQAGHSISAAGDVNGDGGDDLIIGAPAANSSVGRSYVVFGVPDDTDSDGVYDIDDICPDSNLSSTVMIGSCDSGVENFISTSNSDLTPMGCSLSDLVSHALEANGEKGLKRFLRLLEKDDVLSRSDVKLLRKAGGKKCRKDKHSW